ncbi:MAG: hypothetical protein WD772_10065 [Pseudohongiellaceae bacterium]
MPECLESAEYFALLGAAQLNSNKVAESLESLERALLLEPENGAAQVDYAQAQYLQGQLFTAIELNSQLLLRTDLPASLQPLLQERQESWQGLTRQRSMQADLLLGYDTNLNGAPDSNQITLTLSGEPVILPLDSEFRETEGPYLNIHLANQFRQLAPLHQHNFLFELRGRVSENTASDLLQIDARYAFIRPSREHSWQLTSSLSHLFFGGSSLLTATEGRAFYQLGSSFRCKPYYGLALQHQLYHSENNLNSVESKVSAGLNCPLNGQRVSLELSALHISALKSDRPGGDRSGWQVNLDWRFPLAYGELIAQGNYSRLDDQDSYSSLLENGANRWINRSYILIQYLQPLARNATLMINLFHQRQDSNIELFENLNTTAEIGISLAF